MSSRSKLIWITTGILTFTSILFYSIYYWRDIEFSRVLLTLLLIVIVGLLIGLIPFRKQPYKTKIIVTIPFAFILFALFVAGTIVNNEYGLTSKYNYFTAKQDLKKGKVQIITHGLILSPIEFGEEKAAIDSAFGFKTVWEGCIIPNNGYSKYNNVIWKYLNKKNGKGWQKRYEQKIDSLKKANHAL